MPQPRVLISHEDDVRPSDDSFKCGPKGLPVSPSPRSWAGKVPAPVVIDLKARARLESSARKMLG